MADWLLVVLSIGTLDAIASSTSIDESSVDGGRHGLDDSCRYMREMWRILRTDGVLVFITTMDASLFESIALMPIGVQEEEEAYISDWKQGSRMEKVKTNEGGDVYYYSIRKLRSSTHVSSHVPISKGLSSWVAKEGLFRDIQLLLDEAIKAKEEMGDAITIADYAQV